jgi:uncharacterized alkaline shock family protein YloU
VTQVGDPGLTPRAAGYPDAMTSAASAPRPSAPAPGATPGAASLPGAGIPEGAGISGSTEVLPGVVAKVTAFAAREIPGVVALGGSTSRAVGAVRQTLTGSEGTPGIRVDLTDQKAHIAMDVEIEYGVGAKELVRSLRRHVPTAVEEIAGVPVVALDIVITDVHLPGEDAPAPPPAV